MQTAISIRHAVKRYGTVTALHGVSIDIADNEFFTLLGPSGCGKTTLLRMLAGFEDVTEGEILLFGEKIASLPPEKRPVNTVFQQYALFPHLTVLENVAFGLKMKAVSLTERTARARKMLDLVHLSDFADRKPAQLSGGQQQRVALARALAPQPKVLLLDEPLSALDLKLRQAMRVELKALQEETGITFIFVTHDQEEALAMSDRIAVMSSGQVQQIGTPREIYEAPVNRFVASFIGESNFLSAVADKGKVTLKAGGLIDAWINRMAVVQGKSPQDVAPLRGMIAGFAERMSLEERHEWNVRQVYIALGQLMAAAAVIGIDACPMEGISASSYDRILGLDGGGYATVVACALGYRSVDDKYATTPKARFDCGAVIEHI